MKGYCSYLLIFLFIPILFVSAQDDSRADDDAYTDRTANDVEEFVNDIVAHVETGLDRLMNHRSDTDDFEYTPDQNENKNTNGSNDAVTFNGDTEIAETDTIQGDLVVKYGTLTIRGVVNGDVLVVNGTILVKSTGHIRGNARAMNGSIVKDDGAIVDGYTEQSTDARPYYRKRTSRVKYSYSFKPYNWVDAPFVDDNFIFRYNRAEGWFFGFGAQKKFYWDGSRIISGYGSFGYGIAMHKWRMQIGLDRQFATYGGDALYEIGGEAHNLTDTKDEWLMKLSENNVAAIFVREDYRDYYQREGFSAHIARYSRGGSLSTMMDVRYLNDRYNTMFNTTTWSLFGGSHGFRANPAINEGIMKSVLLTAGISTTERYRNRTEGWDLYGRMEYAGKEFGGDFDFNQAIVDVRRFQQLSDEDQISLRIRAGSLEGNQIVQKHFELGGANTMPAYGFKEFSGNRMVLANLEYQLQGDVIDNVFFWPSSLNLLFLGDAGAVANVPISAALYEGFDTITSAKIKSDMGFGFGWTDAGARLGFVWRTDKRAPVSIFLRLHRAF